MTKWEHTTPGYRTKTVKGEGFTVNIHRPELTPDTYNRREREVLHALAHLNGHATGADHSLAHT